jgi:hypothetical protein
MLRAPPGNGLFERESDRNLAQALQLINGPAVNDRLETALAAAPVRKGLKVV